MKVHCVRCEVEPEEQNTYELATSFLSLVDGWLTREHCSMTKGPKTLKDGSCFQEVNSTDDPKRGEIWFCRNNLMHTFII